MLGSIGILPTPIRNMDDMKTALVSAANHSERRVNTLAFSTKPENNIERIREIAKRDLAIELISRIDMGESK